MPLADDSPFRKLPSNLNARQRLYLEGIRYSVEAVDLALMGLRHALHDLATSEDPPHEAYAAAVMYAWSVVDSVNRLRVLLGKMPNVKKSAPGFQVFIRKLGAFEHLRNPIQHLDEELNRLGRCEEWQPVWGTISWFTWADASMTRGQSCVLIPGALGLRKGFPVVNPIGKTFGFSVDAISLSAFGHTVALSDVGAALGEFVAKLEKALRPQFAGQPTSSTDLVVRLEIVVGQEETAAAES